MASLLRKGAFGVQKWLSQAHVKRPILLAAKTALQWFSSAFESEQDDDDDDDN